MTSLAPKVAVLQQVLPKEILLAVQQLAHAENRELLSFWKPFPVATAAGKELKSEWKSAAAIQTPKPVALIEQVINYVWTHVMSKRIPGQLAGVEWWLHRRQLDDHMPFHFDKDEGVWKQTALQRHPHWSSIFYVNSVGGPTIIVNQTSSPDLMELHPSVAEDGWRIQPVENQFVMFAGDLLHGVLPAVPEFKRVGDQFVKVDPPAGAARITLMMNWWLHELQDETCVPLQLSDSNRTRWGALLQSDLWAKPNADCREVDVSAKPFRVGKEIRDLHFFDHAGIVAQLREALDSGIAMELLGDCDTDEGDRDVGSAAGSSAAAGAAAGTVAAGGASCKAAGTRDESKMVH